MTSALDYLNALRKKPTPLNTKDFVFSFISQSPCKKGKLLSLLLISLFYGMLPAIAKKDHYKDERQQPTNAAEWPEKYIPIPKTKSAIRFIAAANVVATYDANAYGGDYMRPQIFPLRGVNNSAAKSGCTNIHTAESQVGFATLTHTETGDIRTELSVDFYGSTFDSDGKGIIGYQPSLLKAIIEYQNFTLGFLSSNFLDLDSTGKTVEYGTIMAGFMLQNQIRYTYQAYNNKLQISGSLERPKTDYTIETGAFSGADSSCGVPDMTTQIKYVDSFGHVSLRGLFRQLKLRNVSDVGVLPNVNETYRKNAWGLGISTKIFVYKKSNFFAQFNCGDGIGRYIIVHDGQSAFYDKTKKIFDKQKAYQGIIGFNHFWTNSWSSNLIYAKTSMKLSQNTPALTGTTRVTKSTNLLYTNIIYSPEKDLEIGLEYSYGDRLTLDGKKGKANRFILGALYLF